MAGQSEKLLERRTHAVISVDDDAIKALAASIITPRPKSLKPDLVAPIIRIVVEHVDISGELTVVRDTQAYMPARPMQLLLRRAVSKPFGVALKGGTERDPEITANISGLANPTTSELTASSESGYSPLDFLDMETKLAYIGQHRHRLPTPPTHELALTSYGVGGPFLGRVALTTTSEASYPVGSPPELSLQRGTIV